MVSAAAYWVKVRIKLTQSSWAEAGTEHGNTKYRIKQIVVIWQDVHIVKLLANELELFLFAPVVRLIIFVITPYTKQRSRKQDSG